MFVHINPEADAIGETISTLKFAERVASIELGAARANKETTEIRDLKSEVCFFHRILPSLINVYGSPAELKWISFLTADLKSQNYIREERR